MAVREASGRGTFHPLRVARVDRLCEDAAAVTFDVPDDLAEDFRFTAGQLLTLRRRVGDREERRQTPSARPSAPPRASACGSCRTGCSRRGSSTRSGRVTRSRSRHPRGRSGPTRTWAVATC